MKPRAVHSPAIRVGAALNTQHRASANRTARQASLRLRRSPLDTSQADRLSTHHPCREACSVSGLIGFSSSECPEEEKKQTKNSRNQNSILDTKARPPLKGASFVDVVPCFLPSCALVVECSWDTSHLTGTALKPRGCVLYAHLALYFGLRGGQASSASKAYRTGVQPRHEPVARGVTRKLLKQAVPQRVSKKKGGQF